MNKKIKLIILDLLLLVFIVSYNKVLLFSFIWIALHEVAHIYVGRKIGCRVKGLNIGVLGVNASAVNVEELKENEKLLLYLAGPLFNFIMVILFMFIKEIYNEPWIYEGIKINLTLCLFNLLPAYPLDGSRIWELFISKKVIYKKAKRIVGWISYAIAVLFLGMGVFLLLIHKLNLNLFLVFILITYTTFIEKEKTMYIAMGNMVKKRRVLEERDYIENKVICVFYKKGLLHGLGLVDRNKFNTFYVLDEEMKLKGIIHEDKLIDGVKEYGNITFGELIIKSKQYGIFNK